MRSIRLSLTVYFLALLALALGVAFLVVYRTAYDTLQARRRTAEEQVHAQYKERCEEDGRRRDDALLHEAQELARLTQFQIDFSRFRARDLHLVGLLGTALAPNAHALVPFEVAQSLRGPVSFELYRRQLVEVRLDENDVLRHVDGEVAEYFQIDSSWGSSYHSRSLGGRSFPLDPAAFAPDKVVYWQFDDVGLEPDVPVRRVLLKAAAVRQLMPPRPGPRREEASPERPARGERPPRMAVYVQCAYELKRREEAEQRFAADRDRELAAVAEQADDSLAHLRRVLLGLGAFTFAAAAAGCLGLVRLGLLPLRRLSVAVSRVSAKDFRLPFDEPRLPAELRPIVDRLAGTLEQLKRAFAREKQATADISHELRTPLASLLTTAEFALRKPRTAEEYRELFEDAQVSARQMNRAVERLLTLARLDAGVDTLRLEPVDVAALAGQCAALVRPLAEAQGLRLVVHAEPGPPVVADPDKLREVITNLLHNAVQYNRPGGEIELRVGRKNGHLEVAVRDTGIGIAPEARAHLFERFWRADASRGGDGLHAGLGLAIVKGYADLMGGAVTVDSAEGRGSTFRVSLPAQGPRNQPPRPRET
jgi:heavy metal sensor kinase